MWLVKLGGSLQDEANLEQWIAMLAEQGRGRVVLVPGGGQFAEAVRAAQRRWRFDEVTAHHMALLAMEQYGRMLAGMQSHLVPAREIIEIENALAAGRVPVWMPFSMVISEHSIPASWDVTSDSLAAWLAARLGAEVLVLVKSTPDVERETPTELSRRGLVDAAFPRTVAEFRGLLAWFCAAHPEELARAISAGRLPEAHIIPVPRADNPVAA